MRPSIYLDYFVALAQIFLRFVCVDFIRLTYIILSRYFFIRKQIQMNKKRLEINTTLNSQLSPINNSYFIENLTKQSVCEQYEIDPHYRGWHILQKRQHKLPAVVSDTSLGSTLTAVEQNLPYAIAAIKNQKKTTNLKEDIPKYKVGDEIGVTDEEIAAWENTQPQEFPTCRMKPIEFGKVPVATETEQILWD